MAKKYVSHQNSLSFRYCTQWTMSHVSEWLPLRECNNEYSVLKNLGYLHMDLINKNCSWIMRLTLFSLETDIQLLLAHGFRLRYFSITALIWIFHQVRGLQRKISVGYKIKVLDEKTIKLNMAYWININCFIIKFTEENIFSRVLFTKIIILHICNTLKDSLHS